MHALFSAPPVLLKISAQGGLLIILVLGAQWLCGGRLSPRWRYALWLLVLLRLALPWSIPSPFSLFSVVKFPTRAPATLSQTTAAAPPDTPNVEDQTPTITVSSSGGDWFTLVWAVGASCLAICAGASHYKIYRRVVRQRPLIDEDTQNLLEDCKTVMDVSTPVTLIETSAIPSPTLFGFVRPR